jgi:cytochrome b involved in lipid metabolism
MPQPTFTWEEVARHNTPESAFVAIEGKVYDVTAFVDKHPGGRDQLLRGSGRDVSAVFRSYHKDSTFG